LTWLKCQVPPSSPPYLNTSTANCHHPIASNSARGQLHILHLAHSFSAAVLVSNRCLLSLVATRQRCPAQLLHHSLFMRTSLVAIAFFSGTIYGASARKLVLSGLFARRTIPPSNFSPPYAILSHGPTIKIGIILSTSFTDTADRSWAIAPSIAIFCVECGRKSQYE